jgi:hypothetical protein
MEGDNFGQLKLKLCWSDCGVSYVDGFRTGTFWGRRNRYFWYHQNLYRSRVKLVVLTSCAKTCHQAICRHFPIEHLWPSRESSESLKSQLGAGSRIILEPLSAPTLLIVSLDAWTYYLFFVQQFLDSATIYPPFAIGKTIGTVVVAIGPASLIYLAVRRRCFNDVERYLRMDLWASPHHVRILCDLFMKTNASRVNQWLQVPLFGSERHPSVLQPFGWIWLESGFAPFVLVWSRPVHKILPLLITVSDGTQ